MIYLMTKKNSQAGSRSRSRSRSPRSVSGTRSRSRSYSSYSSRSRSRSYSRSRSRSLSYSRSRSRSPYSRRRRSLSPLPTKILVNKLTKNVTDAHLNEIFGAFGRIHRQSNKGTAFIDYETRAEAERAISYMDGGQLDGSELSCTFVPRRPISPLPPRRRGIVEDSTLLLSVVLRRVAIVLAVDLHCVAIQDHDQDRHQYVEDVLIHIVLIVRGVDQDHLIPEVVVEESLLNLPCIRKL
ncbi:4374_t:CDS:2 [Funneliformis mosseae]|uniref:4374_t:CDS:1 n=1 Tax=Funneliformis mosseae TaxID=27381 RepID=A0A9N9C5N1_FUNMO|nr:4374_t:CDS:2 [Funneliformis mosseae]